MTLSVTLVAFALSSSSLGIVGCAAPGEQSASASAAPVLSLSEEYLERMFELFPSRATAAGRTDHDHRLELIDAQERAAWIAFNEGVEERLAELPEDLPRDESIDRELLRRHIERVLFDWQELRRPEKDPTFWSAVISDAATFLVVRTGRPEEERFRAVLARVEQIPRLVEQARLAIDSGPAEELAPEFLSRAIRQLESSAVFYEGDVVAAYSGEEEELRAGLERAGAEAGRSMRELALHWYELEARAAGSPILGAERYARIFHIVNGVDEPPLVILAQARQALADKKKEAAAFGRSVWSELMPGRPEPSDDGELLRALFEHVASLHASSVDEFVLDYKQLLIEAERFVRERSIVTLPDPLTVTTDRSPEFFSGQGIGGVYPAGPYAPEEQTLFYLPTPSESMTREQREAFFRDFNHPFNVMITPHEMIPGHYLQGKVAARHPRKVRSLFADGVYTEGWGTFCERLMLDQGWGEPVDRLAHLKKQLENIARTIVDIRVHSESMTRDQVIDFVQGEALQDAHFASNMWSRALTSAPQITSYWLGYRELQDLYQEVQRSRGEAFELRQYMDQMVSLGGAPIARYRELVL